MAVDKKAKAKFLAPYLDSMIKIGGLPRQCLISTCTEKAIDSHILQQNGILNKIAQNNFVYQTNSNLYSETQNVFQKKPINGALTFKGFCGFHDTEIFKKIEKVRVLDLDDYETCLLLSYRSILFVYREREIVLEHQKWMLESKYYLKVGQKETDVQNLFNDYQTSFESIRRQKEVFEGHLQNISGQEYLFAKREIPLIEVCCCQFLALQLLTGLFFDKPEMSIFFNIIPFNSKSLVIFGYRRDDEEYINKYLKAKLDFPQKDFIYFVNNLLLSYGNDWVCSPSFYFDRIRPYNKNLSKVMNWAKFGWSSLPENPLRGMSPINILRDL